MKTSHKLPLLLGLAALCTAPSQAAVVANTVIGDTATSLDNTITASLITAGSPALQSITPSRAPSLSFSAGGLNDGLAVGKDGSATFPQSQATLTFFEDLRAPLSITIKFNSAYNISSVASLAGWGDTFFGSQQFTLAFETGNSGSYTQLGGIFGQTPYTPAAPPGFPEVPDPDFSTKTTISDDSAGFLATNVTGIQITYQDPYPSFNQFNGIVIRELTVSGSAVPEVQSSLLVALSSLALLRRRR